MLIEKSGMSHFAPNFALIYVELNLSPMIILCIHDHYNCCSLDLRSTTRVLVLNLLGTFKHVHDMNYFITVRSIGEGKAQHN